MKTIEQAASELTANAHNGDYTHFVQDAFKKGVEFAQRWIPASEELPDEDGSYLCKDTYDDSVKMLVYNKYHGCWDDHSGDDYYCDIDRISHWRKINL
jgi:hypothetical protein